MIVGVLAILKAGGAYVPLDPAYASKRLRDILADAAPSIILTDRSGRDALGEEALRYVIVVELTSGHDTEFGAERSFEGSIRVDHRMFNPQVRNLTSHHLAYIIYTSGSMGKPKGALIGHQGVVNLIHHRPAMLGIVPSSRVLQFTSLSFDHSVSEIFSALTSGASLHLIQDDIRLDRSRLFCYLSQHSVTHVSFTPTLLHDCKNLPELSALQVLIVMGEALPSSLLRMLQQVVPNGSIINSYGPTEITVSAITWKSPHGFDGSIVPIGRPIFNKRIYILDKHGQPVPLGAIGE
ncbi:hypothetical protein BGZ65_012541, partial [Modicella reniformis]